MPVNILIAIGNHWRSGNPIAVQFKKLAEELIARGYSVTLLVPGLNEEAIVQNGNPRVLTWPSPRPTRLADAIFLARLLIKEKPVCVIANFAAMNWMMLMGRLFRIPLRIAWCHTSGKQIDLDWTGSSIGVILLRIRKRWVYSLASFVATNSLAMKKELEIEEKIPPEKSIVVHNSLEDPQANFEGVENLSFDSLVVFPGRLNKSKGQDVFIRAVHLLKNDIPDIRAVFLGDGPMRQELVALAQQLGIGEKCYFAGRVPHSVMLEEMRRAWFTVVASRSEAFGLVNIESMAMGTPVIATAVGGIPEIIRDGVDGYLIPPDDPICLADRMEKLIRDPKLRADMGRHARERFLEKFETAVFVKKMSDWLDTEIRLRINSK